MNDSVTVIDIVAQVTDETASGVQSAEKNVSKLERSVLNLQKQIMGMKGKSKLEVAATLKDMASKGIQNVAAAGKKIAGKVWTVTLKAADLVTAPFKKIASLIANPIAGAAAFAGISLGAADTINTFKDFESAMASVAATAGVDKTSDTFASLEKAAREAGATTTKSAAEAANALEYMSLAGWDAQTSIQALPKVLQLSEATGMELGRTSDLITDSMAALGLTVDELPGYLDKVAKAQTASNQSAEQLMEAYLGVGGLFKDLGIGITESATALGVLANRGTKGTEAATALNATLLNLTTGTGEAGKMMDDLGLSAFDSKGKFIGLQNVLKKINIATASMTQEQKNATLAAIGGKEHVASLNKLLAGLNETNAEGVTEWDALTASIEESSGALEDMARRKNDTLAGSLSALASAADEVKISIGEKLEPYVRRLVDFVTAHMPDIQTAVGKAVDFVTGKIDRVIAAVKSLTGSQEWQNAETLWDKIHLAWDKLIAEPFDAWWGSTGKAWITEKASSIGEGLGTALKSGVLALLGVDTGGAVTDGLDIGKSFADGFMDGFDGSKVGEALAKAIKDGLKSLVLDAATLLPGGKEASGTSGLSAAVLGYGAFKTAKTGYNIYKGGKALVNGTKAVGSAIGNATGISEGVRIFKAAQGGGSAAQSALTMAQNGALGRGMKYGAKLAGGASKAGKILSKVTGPLAGGVSKAGKFISKAAGPALAGITSAIQLGADAYHGVGRAKEWTGSDSTGSKVASGIGAAVGGLGDGILGDESLLRKTSNVGGGALKGAGIGAAVGSILPGVGTAIGGAVGAGIGAAGAAIGGSNIAKALSTAGAAVGGFFTKTVPEKFGQFAEGAKGFFDNTISPALSTAGTAVKGFFTETVPEKFGEFRDSVTGFMTETVPQALSSAGSAVSGFFTETVPAKFGELVDGVGSFFTETVPFAIGYTAGKIQIFFTETVPQFFGNLVEGVKNFFTQTVPAAIETVGSALNGFFTQTVPEFFTGLWNGVTNFFTVTVPAAIDAAGSAVTNFFTVSVPQFFGDLWNGITGFFTDTVQPAIETVGAAVTNFFTVTVPEFFTGLWEGITGFFTETVPQALETIGTALSAFFTETIPAKMQEVWGGVVDVFTKKIPEAIGNIGETIGGFFANVKEKITGFFGGIWNKITGSASAGYETATATPHAEGGIMTRPHLGLVAEDGAEAIIPLSGNRRERGLDLWERTGEMLGVKPYADGGIIGGNAPEPMDAPAPVISGNAAAPSSAGGNGGGTSIPVTIQSLKVEINVDGSTAQNPQELAAAIRENIRGMTDDIAYQLAVAMQQAFANTPKEGWRT